MWGIASHDPFTWGMTRTPPEDVQEREHDRQGRADEAILGAQQLNPALLLTDTPRALDRPSDQGDEDVPASAAPAATA
jgi:hypothetical protein